MTTVKNIKLNSIKQLIDLNGDKVNFELTVQVSSENKEPFEALVVTQTILDSDQELKYKKVENGFMSINISNDKGVYENYLLLLKCDKAVNCEIKIDIKDIAYDPKHEINKKKMEREFVERESIERESIEREKQIINKKHKEKEKEKEMYELQKQEKQIVKKKSGINIRLILTIIVIGLGGMLLWYFLNKKKKSNIPNQYSNQMTNQIPNYIPNQMTNQIQIPTYIPTPSINPQLNIESIINENLLSKINNIPIS